MSYKSFFNWSGGKDSALALYYALKDKSYSVEKLLTNINNQYRRISMHGVREELLEQQATSIGIPLRKLVLSDHPSMVEYEEQMMQTMRQLEKENFTHGVFGDIFLEDLKTYRETQLAKVNMSAVFPLWKRNTTELIHEFIDLGFKTIVVCVKAELLDESFAGRIIDNDFLKDLPCNVDPCGENGEFHTFVFNGPIFEQPISYKTGEKVFREYKTPENDKDNCFTNQPFQTSYMGFWFCDLLPK
ncbi:MAG: diphthine--ammonia ligase [Segetibacter sp.]